MVSSLTQANRHSEAQDSQKIVSIRHTCAHIMAMAVQKLYPGTKVAIGPVTEIGTRRSMKVAGLSMALKSIGVLSIPDLHQKMQQIIENKSSL